MADKKSSSSRESENSATMATEVNNMSIIPRDIEVEMKSAYLDYAMSVIVGRALPDVRDGLKPVQRRILYTMYEMGLTYRSPYKKSARVVGDTLGKYHPHGDMAVYEAMVRMAQDFSLRYTLIDGQGNFGSIDGDPPAAMRYTEVRLQRIAEELLADIEKNTVDFMANYDNSLLEPVVLPAKLPNLLVNGSSGIAVGMATNIPPHNLCEIVDGIIAYIDNNDISIEELMKIVKGPDFPTGGIIYGREGIKEYFATGKGTLKVRGKVDIEDIGHGKKAIVITEIPYQVNKAQLLETIATLVREKKIEDISDIRDESDREGMRIVVEVKRDGNEQVVLNQLFKHTALETTFGVIMLALVNNKPRVLGLKNMFSEYVQYRREVIIRRTRYELDKADKRAHILEGFKIAIEHLEKVIKIIRSSENVDVARSRLIEQFGLSREQAQAILDMKLQQLTALEREKIEKEYVELIKEIERLKLLLANPQSILNLIKEELLELRKTYGDDRRTKIVSKTVELDIEDLIAEEDVIVLISHAGYIKRIPLSSYRTQGRGGKGVTTVIPREEDYVKDVFSCSTHSYILFFTNKGKVYWLKVYEIPETSRHTRGKPVNTLIRISPDERVSATVVVRDFDKIEKESLLMVTRKGIVKRSYLKEFANPRPSGIIAIKLLPDDELIDVKIVGGDENVIIATREGLAAHYPCKDLRIIGRATRGIRGIRLNSGDEVVGVELVSKEDTILVISENGYGKRTLAKEYRLTHRGGKGVKNMKITDKTGKVVGIRKVSDEDDVIIVTTQGISIRIPAKTISVMGRATQGVRLIRLEEGDKVATLESVVSGANADISSE
jgi:DNA gyrase subunit A